jgi:type IX secretion system PorP/SprF family membrane protein
MKKVVVILLLLPLLAFAQQESYYSLYRFNMQVINPAFAGAEADNMLTLLNRSQWAELDDSPRTMVLGYSSKRENNVGLGISIVSDKVFVEKQTFAYVDFSYMLDLGDSKVFLGLKGGGNFYRSSSLNLEDYNTGFDPAQKEFSRFNPNVGAGAYFQNPNFWFSFSIPRLFNVKRDMDINIGAKDRVHSYLGGGINFEITEDILLKPNLMLRSPFIYTVNPYTKQSSVSSITSLI